VVIYAPCRLVLVVVITSQEMCSCPFTPVTKLFVGDTDLECDGWVDTSQSICLIHVILSDMHKYTAQRTLLNARGT